MNLEQKSLWINVTLEKTFRGGRFEVVVSKIPT